MLLQERTERLRRGGQTLKRDLYSVAVVSCAETSKIMEGVI